MTAVQPRAWFPGLNAVRALGAICVVGTHVGFQTGRSAYGPFSASIARLDCGVALFFVLSGFLLFRPYAVSALTGTAAPPRLRTYLRHRALRILPAYWLLVVAAMALLPALSGGSSVGDWVRHLTLTQIYVLGGQHHGLTQTWSLCTEVAFYLLLPVLARFVLLRGSLRWAFSVMALLGTASALWNPYLNGTGVLDIRSAGQWLPGYLDWFLAGMALALVQVALATGQLAPSSRLHRLEEAAGSAGSCWAAALAVFAIATSPLAGPTTIIASVDVPSGWTILLKNLLYLVLSVLVVLPLVLGPQDQGALRRVLASRPLNLLGELSYGIFLWHLLVVEELARLLHQQLFTGSWLAELTLVLSVTVAVAWVSYRFVERPLRTWRRRPAVVPRQRTSADQIPVRPIRQRV